MKRWLLSIIVLLTFGLGGCTQNQRARTFGGTAKVELPPNTKLIIATWKEEDLWYLHRPMRQEEVPETITFQEDSSFGMVEGTVVFKERRQ